MLNSLNLNKPISEKVDDIPTEEKILDNTSVKNMLHVWVYKLLNNLDDENREMLKFFDLPKQPQTDQDYFKLITSLKIIEHCTSAVEYSSIWLLVISVFLMWFLRFSGNFVGKHFITNQSEEQWSNKIEKKLEDLNKKINDPMYIKKIRYKYLSFQVQQCYDNIRKNQHMELPATHPAFAIASDVLGDVMTFMRDLIND